MDIVNNRNLGGSGYPVKLETDKNIRLLDNPNNVKLILIIIYT